MGDPGTRKGLTVTSALEADSTQETDSTQEAEGALAAEDRVEVMESGQLHWRAQTGDGLLCLAQ